MQIEFESGEKRNCPPANTDHFVVQQQKALQYIVRGGFRFVVALGSGSDCNMLKQSCILVEHDPNSMQSVIRHKPL